MFDYHSSMNTTVFTNNHDYLKKIVIEAFKSEGRKQPDNFFNIAGDCGNGKVAVVVDFGGFTRVQRRVMFRAKNQTHTAVIFPKYTGMSNPEWVKDNFAHTKGNWSWNE